MKQKNQMEVLIDGKIYKLSGAEEEMYLQRVAAYLNGKIGKLRDEEGFSRLSADYQSVLLQLNIADDYFKEEERARKLEEENSALEKQIYSLKHELIRTQMELDSVQNGTGNIRPGQEEEQKKQDKGSRDKNDKDKNDPDPARQGTERKRSRPVPKM